MREWQQPTGGLPPGGEPTGASGWPVWLKLLIILVLLGTLAWVLLLAVQYQKTKRPITELPGVPPQVAGVSKAEPQYLRSIPDVQRPLGVAVGEDGMVYVTESGGERKIHVFDSSGSEVRSFVPPGTDVPSRVPVYVAVSPEGKVYVSDRDANTIYIFSPDGALLGEVAPPVPGEDTWHPLGLAFDRAGNLYVTDVTPEKHRVLVLDPEGKLKRQFGREGSADGEFWFPNAVAIDDQGRIYVSDSNNGRVQVFDSSGRFLYKIERGLARGDLSLPRGIAIDDDSHLFVVDTARQVVQVYDVSEDLPRFLQTFGDDQSQGAIFAYPNGLALDGSGAVYVTDRENNRVQVWRY